VDGAGERHYEAELYRLKGELLLQQEREKRCLQKAHSGTTGMEPKETLLTDEQS
jgi:hypothetical protein